MTRAGFLNALAEAVELQLRWHQPRETRARLRTAADTLRSIEAIEAERDRLLKKVRTLSSGPRR